ncbi:MAG: hypothetical protein ABIR47_16565 [Candidatus Kapaibacterium sp.]
MLFQERATRNERHRTPRESNKAQNHATISYIGGQFYPTIGPISLPVRMRDPLIQPDESRRSRVETRVIRMNSAWEEKKHEVVDTRRHPSDRIHRLTMSIPSRAGAANSHPC